ncbi:hypothetical protein, partial [Alloprevotella tannerae]
IQNISVTLASVIIAIFVCNSMYINTLKLQQISLITKSIDTYNSSNSREIKSSKGIRPLYHVRAEGWHMQARDRNNENKPFRLINKLALQEAQN